ncbi:hypothetical protein V1511DRAFT_512171 [Dipodascopsis uninucleata]
MAMDRSSRLLSVIKSLDYSKPEDEVLESVKEKVLPLIQHTVSTAASSSVLASTTQSTGSGIISSKDDPVKTGGIDRATPGDSNGIRSGSAVQRELPVELQYAISESDQSAILEKTDPILSTACWIIALIAKYQKLDDSNVAEECLRTIGPFLKTMSIAQAKLVPGPLSLLLKKVADASDCLRRPQLALESLLAVALNFSADHSLLSPAHPLYVIQALKAKEYQAAMELLKYDVHNFDSKMGTTYLDHLLFHYYGAHVYMKQKDFEKAEQFLLITVCAPGYLCSLIQVESYKKLILVSLILRSRRPKIPRVANDFSSHSYKIFGKPYDYFAQAYETSDPAVLRLVWSQINGIFQKDNNMGLARQAMKAFRKYAIKMHTRALTAVPLSHIEKRDEDLLDSGLSTEAVINEMIASGMLDAELILTEHGKTVVLFKDPVIGPYHIDKLESLLESIRVLNEMLTHANRQVGKSRYYLTRVAKGGTLAGSASIGSGFEISSEPAIGDMEREYQFEDMLMGESSTSRRRQFVSSTSNGRGARQVVRLPAIDSSSEASRSGVDRSNSRAEHRDEFDDDGDDEDSDEMTL